MPESLAQRTLVKSPPELWAEISDAPSLARRLSAFGEVRITRKEPETAVAWEGALVRGTVELEASGWGTKVTITAQRTAQELAPAEQDTVTFDSAALAEEFAAAEPTAEASATPEANGTDIPPQPDRPAPREGFLARLKVWWHTGTWVTQPAPPAPQPPALRAPEVEPAVRADAAPAPAPAPPPEPAPDPELEGILVAVLDDLGSAHHRPFSRA